MGRPSYVCTVCSEHFTRKYSAKVGTWQARWVEVQVGTWQAIRHGIVSREDLNGIAVIPLRITLLLTLQVRSDLKPCSNHRCRAKILSIVLAVFVIVYL